MTDSNPTTSTAPRAPQDGQATRHVVQIIDDMPNTLEPHNPLMQARCQTCSWVSHQHETFRPIRRAIDGHHHDVGLGMYAAARPVAGEGA